jgi:hypothetical protein
MKKEMLPLTIEVQYGRVTFMRSSLVETRSVEFMGVELIITVVFELIAIEETRVGAIKMSVKNRKTLAESGMIAGGQ